VLLNGHAPPPIDVQTTTRHVCISDA